MEELLIYAPTIPRGGSGAADSSQYTELNYCNGKIEMAELSRYYGNKTGSQFARLPMELWLDRASGLGLDPILSLVLRELVGLGELILVPSLRKGKL